MGSFEFIPRFPSEFIEIGGVHIQVGPFEFPGFFSVGDYIGDSFFLIVGSLIDGVFLEIGFDDMHFAEMATALAMLTDAGGGVMMREIRGR